MEKNYLLQGLILLMDLVDLKVLEIEQEEIKNYSQKISIESLALKPVHVPIVTTCP